MATREAHQIRVHLIEARGLKGKANESDLVNPVVRVNLEAGNVKKTLRSAIYKDVSSVFFDEHMIFSQDLARDEFNEGRIQIQMEDSQGIFTNTLIGETSFDLHSVHEAIGHEVFNRWVPLISPERPGVIQGFLRTTVIVLKAGEVPKTHTKAELEDDGSAPDPDGGMASMLVGLPDIALEPFQLTIRVYRVEIATYGLPRPDSYIRVRVAGTKPLKSGVVKASYNPNFQDELCVPIYLPTFTDRIIIELLDKDRDHTLIADFALSLVELRSEDMDPCAAALLELQTSSLHPLAGLGANASSHPPHSVAHRRARAVEQAVGEHVRAAAAAALAAAAGGQGARVCAEHQGQIYGRRAQSEAARRAECVAGTDAALRHH